MARYLTSGVVVLADDHPHTQGTLDAARAFAGHRYAVGHDGGARFGGFDDVVDPGRDQPTVAATFKEAQRRKIPWVAVRRDLAPPADLLGQLLEATARRTSKELPGFVVLLSGPEKRKVRRILAIVDRSDGQPSGLMILAAVAAAEQTGAAVDVLVIGAPHEELDSSARPDEILRVTRDRDLYEQAQRRSENLGARGHWMFVDHVESRIHLVRDVIASQEYDLVVDDIGDVNLGGRMGRHKRISHALRKGGPASITVAVLKKTDLPVLLVLDAIRLGLVPARVKAGAGAGVLALGVMVSAAPAAAGGRVERERAHTSISQTVDSYDDALTAAASLAAPASVEAAHAQARASAEQAQASVDAAATETDQESADADQSAEKQSEDQQSEKTEKTEKAEDEKSEESKADEPTADEQAGETGEATSEEGVAPADLAPEEVTPEKAPTVDPEDVAVPEDVSRSDVEKAQKAASKSKDALDEAKSEFEKAQEAAVEAKDETVDASAAAVEASTTLSQADAAYEEATAEADDVIASARGVSGAVSGAATAEDVAAAEAQQADAVAELEKATTQADETLDEYQEAATAASEASVELDAAAEQVTEAQAQYNEDKATATAYEKAYEAEMADARVSPVAEGEYTSTGHYGDAGHLWSTGYHTGEDYAAPVGTEVVAAASGTVVEVTYGDPAYGNRIVIEHENGYYTTYNHLSTVDVAVGEQVTAGDAIGEVGNTGNSTGAHLHFEVTHNGDGWSGGEFVDPDAWLAGDIG